MASKCDVISSPVYVTVEWNGRLWKESLNSDGPQYQQNKTITSHLNSLNTFEVDHFPPATIHVQRNDKQNCTDMSFSFLLCSVLEN